MPPETLANVVDAVCAALRNEDTLYSLRELSGSSASPFVAAAALLLLPSVRFAVRRTTPRWCPHNEFVCLSQSVAAAPERLVVSPDGLWLRLAEPVAPLSDTAAARARAGCESSQAGHFAGDSCAATRIFCVVLLPADPLLLPREVEVNVPSGGCILAALASFLGDASPLRPALAPSPPLGARPKPGRPRGKPRLFCALPVHIRSYGNDDNSDSLRPNPRASWLAGTALRGDAVLAHIALPPRNWGGVASTHRRLDVRDVTLTSLGVLAAASLPSGLGLDDHPGGDDGTVEASPKSLLLELCSRFVPCCTDSGAADDDNDGDKAGCGVAFATAAAPSAPPPPPADAARRAAALFRGCSFAAEHAAASGHVWAPALSEEVSRLLSAAPPPPQRARGFVTTLRARRLLPRIIGKAGDVSDGRGGAGAFQIDRQFVVRAWGVTKAAAESAASTAALRLYQAQGEALLGTSVLSLLRAQPRRSSSPAAAVPPPSFLEPGSDGEGDDAACVVDDGVGGAKPSPRAAAPRLFWPPLADQRRAFVSAVVLSACGGAASSVLDLGCGSGELLCFILTAATHIASPMRVAAGVELSPRRAAEAARSLATALAPSPPPHLSHAPPPPRCRVAAGSLFSAHTLFHPGEYDVVTCVEVIEHLPESDADALGRLILRRLAPRMAIVTTPNAECNARMGAWGGHGGGGGAAQNGFRDADHKFEWSRAEMRAWAARAVAACAAEGGRDYAVSFAEIGGVLERRGSESDEDGSMMGASQAAVFTRLGGEAGEALSGAGNGAGGEDEKLSILWDSVQ